MLGKAATVKIFEYLRGELKKLSDIAKRQTRIAKQQGLEKAMHSVKQ